jgi:hypothetical protein
MKALSLAIQKICPMLKFLQTDKQTDRRTGQKLYAPDLSIRGHKNLTSTTIHRVLSESILIIGNYMQAFIILAI